MHVAAVIWDAIQRHTAAILYPAHIQGGPKSKPLQNDQKIVLNRIRFIRQIVVWIKHYNIIRWY